MVVTWGSFPYPNAGKMSTSRAVLAVQLQIRVGQCKHTQREGSSDAFDSANKPFLQLLLDFGGLFVGALPIAFCHDLGAFWPWEKVDEVHNAILMDVACL